MSIKKIIPGEKVIVIASDERMAEIGMLDTKINARLRKYESTVSDVLAKANFAGRPVYILDSTFTVPDLFVMRPSEVKDRQKEIDAINNPEPEEKKETPDESPEIPEETKISDEEEEI